MSVRARRKAAGPPGEPRVAGTALVAADGVRVRFGPRAVLDGVTIEVRAGELLALVGPNGAGKSTLLAVLSGDRTPDEGVVTLDERRLADWAPRDLAQRRSVLPQQVAMAFPFTVDDVVRMGRAPWARTAAAAEDDAVVAQALADTDAAHLTARTFPTLSGGERARVALARVLAQRTQLVLLDEPTAALDLHHQELVLDVAQALVADGAGVVVVLHDLGLAAAHAGRVAVLSDGRIVADGPPADVLTAESLSRVYHHDVEVFPHPRTGALLVVPKRAPSDTR